MFQLPSNGKLCGDEIEQEQSSMKITVVNSGWVLGGYKCTAKDVRLGARSIVAVHRGVPLKQRVVCCESFGSKRSEQLSFCIASGSTANGGETYHIVQARVLFHIRVGECVKEMAFVRYMDVVKPYDKAEELFGCECVRWSTDDEIDYCDGNHKLD